MKVKNFAGFMKTRRMNESDGMEGAEQVGYYGSNPEDELGMGYYGANPEEEEEPAEGEDGESEEGADEELTLENLKAMIDDLTERVKKLEPEEEGEGEEGEEGEKPAEGEEGEKPAEKEATI